MSPKPFPGRSVRKAALDVTRNNLIEYCRALDADQWLQPSKAEGWSVKDVVAHLGGSCRVIFSPGSAAMMTTDDIEDWNEKAVAQRREWPSWKVLDEFETWSRRAITLGNAVSLTPMAHARVPVGEIGTYPVGHLMAGAPVFDQFTHLHHDIAPAVGQTAPRPSTDQLEVAVAWMVAVLANQLRKAPMAWVGGPVNLELTGPGGAAMHITSGGLLKAGASWAHAATITAGAESFVSWGTKRTAWKDGKVELGGDESLAARVLDGINVV
ncbi:uncharacterized protein (TIGR03083 family) [Actinocorallia herbida]|uniref:Uncharacterized protein (TIGR03083 family) n=1 Tax=Actinocorallia herbida TaxID=58109 RepID=A0A3N1D2T0_9ACTN|nr:maleylpyruvate isomerase family mycothiol-dependent enzyme [Actinocorallia herbida]ROO87837.1 uncharacterized protein (TIGR03083 family) [Actinocorallia herbida]